MVSVKSFSHLSGATRHVKLCTDHTTNSSVINSKTLHSSSTCQKQFFYKNKLQKHKKSHLHKDFKHRICSKGFLEKFKLKTMDRNAWKLKPMNSF